MGWGRLRGRSFAQRPWGGVLHHLRVIEYTRFVSMGSSLGYPQSDFSPPWGTPPGHEARWITHPAGGEQPTRLLASSHIVRAPGRPTATVRDLCFPVWLRDPCIWVSIKGERGGGFFLFLWPPKPENYCLSEFFHETKVHVILLFFFVYVAPGGVWEKMQRF